MVQLELEKRELHYGLEQAREGARASDATSSQLRERLDRLETRLGEEVEGKQVAELRVRELEVMMRSVKSANQQLSEERDRLKAQFQAESEARILQEGIYQEQVHHHTYIESRLC